MRCVCLALGLAVLVPAAARAEPIPVSVNAAANGFTQSGSAMTSAALNLGTVVMPSVNSVGMLLIDGPLSASDYVVSFMHARRPRVLRHSANGAAESERPQR
jgi:hypothetical protein